MATVKINDIDIRVDEGTLILDAARQAGFYIPTFCYQADLIGIGSCRMCIVEIEGQRKLHPSCITPVMDGMHILTETDRVNQARADMLEFLLSNHGLDCPVCDKGGECELQDMVYRFGPQRGRYSEKKHRWHEKDYIVSPVIIKNSNRCVQCMKCVRVCREVVGRDVLSGINRGVHQEETTFFKTMLDCDQDGNCIEVCPVGCFMRRPFRYKTRPWDLVSADTVCPYCGTGCRMVIEERDGLVIRSRAQLGVGINSETLCARGRFGYDFIHHPKRLSRPLLRKEGVLCPVTWEAALAAIEKNLGPSDPMKTGGIASSRLTNEGLYLFQKLFRTVFKSSNIDSGTRWDSAVVKEFIFTTRMTRGGASVFDAMGADHVLILGTHLSDENPVTEYMVRRMARENDTRVSIVSPRAMKLDGSAAHVLRHLPGTEKDLLLVLTLSVGKKNWDRLHGHPALDAIGDIRIKDFVDSIGVDADRLDLLAGSLSDAASVGILIGTEFLRFPQGLKPLSVLADVLERTGKAVSFVPVLDRCNQRGAWEMGVHPGLLPGYREQTRIGLGFRDMLRAAEDGELESLYLIGEDPVTTHPDPSYVRGALAKIKFLLVQDIFLTETATLADCVLPGACFAEKAGTFTNQEGRVQSLTRLMKPPGEARSDLEIIGDIGRLFESGFAPATRRFLPVFDEIRGKTPMYATVDLNFINQRNDNNDLDNRAALVADSAMPEKEAERMPRVSRPFDPADEEATGFILITGNHLFHSGGLSRKSDILNSLLKEPVVEISDDDARRLGLSSGDTVRVSGRRHQAVLVLETRPGTKPGVAFIAENFENVAVNRFFGNGRFIARVNIAKVDSA